MTKKGKKKKQEVAAAASTSEDVSSKTSQQQQKQDQTLSQVLPGPSQQKISKDPQQQQQQKVKSSQPHISQSEQQIASSSQKQQSQPQQQQQKQQQQQQKPQQQQQKPQQQQQKPQQQQQKPQQQQQKPQQQQAAQAPWQQQQIPQGQQLQGAWLKRQQPQQPQQQATQVPQQPQEIPQNVQLQKTGVQWQQPQSQQQAAQGPPQYQQIPQGQQQPQGARVQQQQAQGQLQQQAAQAPWQYQQMPQGQQQPRGARVQWQQPQGHPQQQAIQGPWQYQQMPQGQQQPQGARVQWQQLQGQPQQQVAQSSPQYQQMPQGQQPQGARVQQQQPQGQPQQQAAQSPPQYQQMPQGQPRQQAVQGSWQQTPQSQPQQVLQSQAQQQQRASTSTQQQKASTSIQQQKVSTSTQQQQQAPYVRAAGDQQAVGMHPQQPSTSTKSFEVSELVSINPFHSEVIEKAKMSSAQLAYYQDLIPKRVHPDKGGSKGIKIEVLTNMFKIILDKNFVTNAVHYDVTIKPYKQSTAKNGKKDQKKEPKLSKALCRKIFEQFRNKHFNSRYPAYDGKKNAFSANDLPFVDDMADVFEHENLNGRKNQYQIIIKKVANVDLSCIKNMGPGLRNRDQTAEQVLDIIMRHAPESRFTNIGRSLFWDINEKEPLGGGIALARGGFMAGVLGWKMYLNVDISHKGFTMKQTILSYLAEVVRVSENELTYESVAQYMPKIQSFLRNLKINYEIPNVSKRTHRIIKLSEQTSYSEFTQKSDNGEERKITIQQYFMNSKKYKIKRPDLQTLHVTTRADGSEILLPIELCTIMPGQPIRKLDEEQTSNMIKKTVTNAEIRRNRIEQAFDTIEVNNSPVMKKEFHLSVSEEMEKVPARILPAPELKYKEGKTQVKKGTWWLQPFFDAKNLENNSWTIVNISGQTNIDPIMQEFKDLLQKTASELNMRIGQPTLPFRSFLLHNLNGITKYFNDNKNLKLIIVILPNRTDAMYGKVKKITEMEVGVLTQCMKILTLRRLVQAKQAATVKNILQKINSKLNGINHTFDKLPSCFLRPCMLVGADVTHPSPDSKDTPSIAAVAASRDKTAFKYNVTLRLQQPKEEMILDLEQIILSQLEIFVRELNICPKRIIYYRDGVSEGQLAQVMYYEVEAIKRAITKFTHASKKDKIEITCLVVQKRHHVRLFPTDPRGEIDPRTKNVQAGTIVDTNITHPDHIDFYLVSHASIQGTARPTKYRCIYNDSKFTEDELEELTYYLCHIYARCTRSVSYPAPTYYAHLGAYRGRALIQGNNNFRLSDLEREQKNFILKMGESPMFFV